MERRNLALIPFTLALMSSGCFTTQGSKDLALLTPPAGVAKASSDAPLASRKDDGARRAPQPRTEIAFGAMKELEADSEAGKRDPDAQARMRDEARQAYQAALKLDPTSIDAYRHLGRLYVKMGDYERALDTYKKAMARHPRDAGLWYDLGMYHQRRRELNESVRCLAKAIEIEPENPTYLKKLGFTLAYMGNIEHGLVYLTRAQGAALAHYGIARVLIQRDQPEAARHHLQMALRENSQLDSARELLSGMENQSTSRPGAARHGG